MVGAVGKDAAELVPLLDNLGHIYQQLDRHAVRRQPRSNLVYLVVVLVAYLSLARALCFSCSSPSLLSDCIANDVANGTGCRESLLQIAGSAAEASAPLITRCGHRTVTVGRRTNVCGPCRGGRPETGGMLCTRLRNRDLVRWWLT